MTWYKKFWSKPIKSNQIVTVKWWWWWWWWWWFDPVFNNSNSPCLIFNNVNGYIIEKCSKDKYLIIASTNQNKKVFKKYTKLWNEIKNQIETIGGCKPIIDKKHFMKIRFKSDDNLSLGIILNIPSLTIVIRSVFQEGNNEL